MLHDSVGRTRHLAVTDDGIVYVELRVPNPKGLVALRDTSGDGRADDVEPGIPDRHHSDGTRSHGRT
ncbi:MAG: hypothetical protein ACRD15_19820, partial [Vicinamibacterales bacterium]